MSFFSKLVQDIESIWKKAPKAEVTIASAINYTVPFVESLDDVVTPELAPILNPILDKVKVGLSALKVTIQDSESPNGATTLLSIVSSVNTNLKALVSAAQVKDPATAQKIQEVATLVTGELNAITGQ